MGGRSREFPNSTPACAREGRFNNVAENGDLRACKETTESVLCVGFPAVW